jgi:hypothetical protein
MNDTIVLYDTPRAENLKYYPVHLTGWSFDQSSKTVVAALLGLYFNFADILFRL